MSTTLGWGAVIVAVITTIGLVVVALIGRSSNRMTAGNSAGELALKLAQESKKEIEEQKKEIKELRLWQTTVRAAWREHEEYDDMILDRLEALAPGTKASLPPRPPLPID